jgi:hypothetical protein
LWPVQAAETVAALLRLLLQEEVAVVVAHFLRPSRLISKPRTLFS